MKCKRRFMHGKRRRRSPIKQVESVSDSTRRGHSQRPIEIEKEKEPVKTKTREERTGIIYDPTKKRLDVMMQTNPIATLFVGRKKKA